MATLPAGLLDSEFYYIENGNDYTNAHAAVLNGTKSFMIVKMTSGSDAYRLFYKAPDSNTIRAESLQFVNDEQYKIGRKAPMNDLNEVRAYVAKLQGKKVEEAEAPRGSVPPSEGKDVKYNQKQAVVKKRQDPLGNVPIPPPLNEQAQQQQEQETHELTEARKKLAAYRQKYGNPFKNLGITEQAFSDCPQDERKNLVNQAVQDKLQKMPSPDSPDSPKYYQAGDLLNNPITAAIAITTGQKPQQAQPQPQPQQEIPELTEARQKLEAYMQDHGNPLEVLGIDKNKFLNSTQDERTTLANDTLNQIESTKYNDNKDVFLQAHTFLKNPLLTDIIIGQQPQPQPQQATRESAEAQQEFDTYVSRYGNPLVVLGIDQQEYLSSTQDKRSEMLNKAVKNTPSQKYTQNQHLDAASLLNNPEVVEIIKRQQATEDSERPVQDLEDLINSFATTGPHQPQAVPSAQDPKTALAQLGINEIAFLNLPTREAKIARIDEYHQMKIKEDKNRYPDDLTQRQKNQEAYDKAATFLKNSDLITNAPVDASKRPQPDASLNTRDLITKHKANPFILLGINASEYFKSVERVRTQLIQKALASKNNNPSCTTAAQQLKTATPQALQVMMNDAALIIQNPQQAKTHQVQDALENLSATYPPNSNNTSPGKALIHQNNSMGSNQNLTKNNDIVTKDKTREDFYATCNQVTRYVEKYPNFKFTPEQDKATFSVENEKFTIAFHEPQKTISYHFGAWPIQLGPTACLKAMRDQGETEVNISSTDLYGAGYTAIEAKRLGLKPIFDPETVSFIKSRGYTDTNDFLKQMGARFNQPDDPHTTIKPGH